MNPYLPDVFPGYPFEGDLFAVHGLTLIAAWLVGCNLSCTLWVIVVKNSASRPSRYAVGFAQP
jgi:hypothetical protein